MSGDWLLPPLAPGACLAVIAPAGPPREGTLSQVVPMMARLGWRAKVYPSCAGPAVLGHLAASDEQRVADLHAAFTDPDVDAVIGLRGGYGCMRLLDKLDMRLLRASSKPLIGYSDLTALHAVLQGNESEQTHDGDGDGPTQGLGRAPEQGHGNGFHHSPSQSQSQGHGRIGWHAPMPASDWHRGDEGWADALALTTCLQQGLRAGDVLGPTPVPHRLNRRGPEVRGRLTGGNLAVLAALVGTPYMPDLRGSVLFLEDVGEDPYKIDRLLCQLRLAGHLNDLAGLVLGSFSDAGAPDEVLADYLQPLDCPVLAAWPAGHATPNLPLPLGAWVSMDAKARTLRVVGG